MPGEPPYTAARDAPVASGAEPAGSATEALPAFVAAQDAAGRAAARAKPRTWRKWQRRADRLREASAQASRRRGLHLVGFLVLAVPGCVVGAQVGHLLPAVLVATLLGLGLGLRLLRTPRLGDATREGAYWRRLMDLALEDAAEDAAVHLDCDSRRRFECEECWVEGSGQRDQPEGVWVRPWLDLRLTLPTGVGLRVRVRDRARKTTRRGVPRIKLVSRVRVQLTAPRESFSWDPAELDLLIEDVSLEDHGAAVRATMDRKFHWKARWNLPAARVPPEEIWDQALILMTCLRPRPQGEAAS